MFSTIPAWMFSGIALLELARQPGILNWLNWFHFLIVMGRSTHILIGCIIFLSLFPDLDAIRMCMPTVCFLTQLNWSRLWNSLPVECLFSLSCDLIGFKLTDTFFLWVFSKQSSYTYFLWAFSKQRSFSSFSSLVFLVLPCLVLLGVQPVAWKKKQFFSKNFY